MNPTIAAYVFLVLVSVVIAFQLALAAGMPWGKLAWGGKFPGKLPAAMRLACVASALLLLAFGWVVYVKSGLGLAQWHALSRTLVWGVVAYCGLGVAANALTPSTWERIIWLPVAILLLVSSSVVAMA